MTLNAPSLASLIEPTEDAASKTLYPALLPEFATLSVAAVPIGVEEVSPRAVFPVESITNLSALIVISSILKLPASTET